MRKLLPSVSLLTAFLAGVLAASRPAQTAPAPTTATNPVLWADVPDPSVIRVGDTYYMSSTTMHMSPGLPIMKSRDLVNWQIVAYAYATLGDNPALTLQDGKNAYGAGSWASSLRYHDGTYSVSTFSSTTGKTHVYRTRDIEHGPWTASSFRPAFHDHSLFFDEDGRVYMVHGSGTVRLTELAPDATAIRPGGVDQVIVPNATLAAGPNVGLPAEGSQLFRVNGKYYLFMITWPRGGMRTQLVFRADKITGPYEGRVALQDQGVAQGGIVDTPSGDWYALLFQDHGAVGRTPFLVPLQWKDGWPVLGLEGKAPATLPLPPSRGMVPGLVASDEFSRGTGESDLPLVWQWNHNPDNRYWSLTQRPGWLRLIAGRTDSDFLSARNTLTQRTFGPTCAATIALDTRGLKDGDCAGLGLLQKRYGFVAVKREGDRNLLVVGGEPGQAPAPEAVPLAQPVVYLKTECDFRNRTDRATFAYSLDGQKWEPIGRPLRMAYTLPHFMGYRFALFQYATKSAGGYADFDYFRVSE